MNSIRPALGFVPQFTLADRLRKAREHSELTQAELADALGISRTSVANAETSVTRPREITMRAWSLATGVSLTWLKTGIAPAPEGDEAIELSRLPESNRRPIHYKVNAWRRSVDATRHQKAS